MQAIPREDALAAFPRGRRAGRAELRPLTLGGAIRLAEAGVRLDRRVPPGLVAGAAAGAFMSALGLFGLAAQGARAAADAVRRLHGWLSRSREEAAALGREAEQRRHEAAAAAAAEQYRRLNSELERTLRLERERDAAAGRRRANLRDREDADLELERQRRLAGLDPSAPGYADERGRVEYEFDARRARLRAARAGEDDGREAARLRRELAAKERAVAEAERLRAADLARAGAARSERGRLEAGRDWLTAPGLAGELAERDRRIAELERREREAEAAAAAKGADIGRMREGAETLRLAAEAAEAGSGAGAARAGAEALAAATRANEREAEARRRGDEEAERRIRANQADAEVSEESAALERRERAEEAAREAARAAALAGAESRADAASALADRLAGGGPGQNRLTALGLGSGVSPRSGIAGDVRKIADLLREEAERSKAEQRRRESGEDGGGEVWE